MRSDNLKNHINNVHRNDLIITNDESSTKVSSTVPSSKMQVINSILGTGMSSNSIPEKVLHVDPVLMKSMKSPGIKKRYPFRRKKSSFLLTTK